MTASTVALEKRVVSIVAQKLGLDETEISSETNFVDHLSIDSLDVVELSMAFEEEFGLETALYVPAPLSDAFNAELAGDGDIHIQTVNDVVSYLNQQNVLHPEES